MLGAWMLVCLSAACVAAESVAQGTPHRPTDAVAKQLRMLLVDDTTHFVGALAGPMRTDSGFTADVRFEYFAPCFDDGDLLFVALPVYVCGSANDQLTCVALPAGPEHDGHVRRRLKCESARRRSATCDPVTSRAPCVGSRTPRMAPRTDEPRTRNAHGPHTLAAGACRRRRTHALLLGTPSRRRLMGAWRT